MKQSVLVPLSIVPISETSERVTWPMLQALLFIHRFRHSTARQLQINRSHSDPKSTYKQLRQLQRLGFIAKKSYARTGKAHQDVTYYLTPTGLSVLQEHFPDRTFRRPRSIAADAILSPTQRARYTVLADAYVHFKRHHDGHFEFFTAHDLVQVGYVPDCIPDGYVRLDIPGQATRHMFIEIFGWGRAHHSQQYRFSSYMNFAEATEWEAVTGTPTPGLHIVAQSPASRSRLHAQLEPLLASSLLTDYPVRTSLATALDSEVSDIWQSLDYN